MNKDIIVIGGGASGLAASIFAARKGADVIILERMDRIGKKLLATGNGKCNYTNTFMNETLYHTHSATHIRQMLSAFDAQNTIRFFRSIGIWPKERDGYVYPNSNQAASVLDALRFELDALGVEIITNTNVDRIQKIKNGFEVHSGNRKFNGRKVILACGGKAQNKLGSNGSGYPILQALDHKIVPVVPALTGLRASEKYFKKLAGVRADGKVTLMIDGCEIASDRGEIQFAEYGISGIPVFQISGQAAYALNAGQKVQVLIDLFPDYDKKMLTKMLYAREKQFSGKNVQVFETGILNRKLIRECLKLAGLKGDYHLPPMQKLADILKCLPATITGSRGYDYAQVCAGGADMSQIDPNTCESRLHKNLYIIGELTDVDGICGGYNLQWAWTTAYLAGNAAGGHI